MPTALGGWWSLAVITDSRQMRRTAEWRRQAGGAASRRTLDDDDDDEDEEDGLSRRGLTHCVIEMQCADCIITDVHVSAVLPAKNRFTHHQNWRTSAVSCISHIYFCISSFEKFSPNQIYKLLSCHTVIAGFSSVAYLGLCFSDSGEGGSYPIRTYIVRCSECFVCRNFVPESL